ncbi:MAG: MATE family efflux transporter [Elusimicrobia bacterium]|nr:MATE family efflux transporter [Elusimicrobiota bacterium]
MRDFTEGSILKQLVYFTVPMLLANLLQAMYSVVDAIWVGRLIGHQAFAAVSTTVPMIFLLVSAIIGLAMATNILVGHAFGSKNMKYLSKVLTNSFISTGFLCIFISALGIIFSKPLLSLLNTPDEIKPMSNIFLTVTLSGLIFTFMYNWFSGVLRGLGDAKTPLYLLIVSTTLNIIIVPILIIGPGPIPKMGVAGSALGTIISNAIMIVVSYFLVLRKHALLNVRQWDFAIDWDIIKKIFTIGIPISLQMIVISLAGVLMVSLVNGFGTLVTAAYGIGMQLDNLAFMPVMAIGISVSSMVAQNLGALKFDRVKSIMKLSFVLSFFCAVFFFTLIYGFPRFIASIFTKEPAVIMLTVQYTRIVSFSYFLFSGIVILQGVVRGSGDTTIMLIFSIITMIFVRFFLAYALSKYTSLNEIGLWLAIPSSAFIGLLLHYWYYRSGRWKKRIGPRH